jgi:hypothetical protein
MCTRLKCTTPPKTVASKQTHSVAVLCHPGAMLNYSRGLLNDTGVLRSARKGVHEAEISAVNLTTQLVTETMQHFALYLLTLSPLASRCVDTTPNSVGTGSGGVGKVVKDATFK